MLYWIEAGICIENHNLELILRSFKDGTFKRRCISIRITLEEQAKFSAIRGSALSVCLTMWSDLENNTAQGWAVFSF